MQMLSDALSHFWGLPSGARAARASLAAAAVGVGITLAACTPGAYSVDLFREMHFQPSQKLQEPNRLAPPVGAVPVSGRAPALTFDEATDLQNPVPANAQTLERAQNIFAVNCAACHGQNADGQSPVADRFSAAGAVPPVNFRDARARNRTDGQLYWILTNGVGNMPPFGDLLTDDQRWTLVRYIRNVQGQ